MLENQELNDQENQQNQISNVKTKQFDLLLNKSGEFYYKSDKFEIKKVGINPWEYDVIMDGKSIKYVLGVDISIITGRHPIISLEIIDA